MMFTDDEVLALSIGLLAARGVGLAEAASAVASAQAKLERVMPVPLKKRVRAVDETVSLDLARRPSTAPRDNAALVALSAAAQRRQRVRMSYQSAERATTERELDPYGLAFRGGHWYAVGLCHLRGGLRSFRLDRVAKVAALDLHFERPAGFDVLAYLHRSVASLPRAHAIEVLLRTTTEVARRSFFPAAGVMEEVEGGVLMRSQADDLDWFARELARLPFPFDVRAPPALSTALAAHARRLLQIAGR
jgi:predicted DNA-binding transcriptional regulator YafY